MTTDTFPELQALRVEVAPMTRDQHLAEIGQAVQALGPVRPRRRWAVAWQRWVVATAAAAVLILPAAAIAADDALPGDLLYPVKRLVEPVVQLVDRDVVAEHRVEELERLVDTRPDAARDLLPEARNAVNEVHDAELTDRLDAVVDSLLVSDEPDPADTGTDRPARDADPTPVSDAPVESDEEPADHDGGLVTDDGGRVEEPRNTDTTTTVAADSDASTGEEHGLLPADEPAHDGTAREEETTTTTSDSPGDRTTDAPVDGDRVDRRDTP